MEDDLCIQSVGIQKKKRITSRLNRIGGIVPKPTTTENKQNANVRKNSPIEKRKKEHTLLKNTSDVKKRLLSTTTKHKASSIKNESTSKKDKKKMISVRNNIENKKNRILENNYEKNDNIMKESKNRLKEFFVVEKPEKCEIGLTESGAYLNEIEENRNGNKIKKNDYSQKETNNTSNKDDQFLKDILKKEHISVQTEINEDNRKVENDIYMQELVEKESSEEDDFNIDLIDQYKKKKKKETDKKKKEEFLRKKAQLIKKVVLKDAETQVVLDDFSIFYERVKPQLDKLIEDILNRALKEIYEEEELKTIEEEIGFYENVKVQKFKSLLIHENKNKQFYNEVQYKIKERSEIRKRVQSIIERKIANSKAQKNVHHIFQVNLDAYSMGRGSFINNFDKSVSMIILPWMSEIIKYLIQVNNEVTHCTINELIEASVIKNTEKYHQLKRWNNKKEK